MKADEEEAVKKPLPHPSKMFPTRWIFDDRSEEPVDIQILDVLIDIRNLVLLIFILVVFL